MGHIGGDDFIFIVPLAHAERVCKTIIANFNIIVSDLFGEEEKAKGYYVARDRKDRSRQMIFFKGGNEYTGRRRYAARTYTFAYN